MGRWPPSRSPLKNKTRWWKRRAWQFTHEA